MFPSVIEDELNFEGANGKGEEKPLSWKDGERWDPPKDAGVVMFVSYTHTHTHTLSLSHTHTHTYI